MWVMKFEEDVCFFHVAGMIFQLTELLEATGNKNSQNILGSGGYGTVYRGTVRHYSSREVFKPGNNDYVSWSSLSVINRKDSCLSRGKVGL